MKQSEEQDNEKVTVVIKNTEENEQKNKASEGDESKIDSAKEDSDKEAEKDGSDLEDEKEHSDAKEENDSNDIKKDKENSDIKKKTDDSDLKKEKQDSGAGEKKEGNNKELMKESEEEPEEDKKVLKNNKDHDSDDNDSADESDEHLGLLDGPVKIVSGSRERKKVERFEITVATPKDSKFELFEGTGKKFRDISLIEDNISKMKAADLQVLHKILYGSKGTLKTVKKHLREFSGFPNDISDSDKLSKQKYMTNLFKNDLFGVCKILNLEKKGTKDEVIERVMEFLLEPKDHNKKIPERKRSKKGRKKSDVKKRLSTKKKGKAAKSGKEEEQDDDSDLSDSKDSDDEEDNDKKKSKSTPKRKIKKKVKSLPEVDSEKEEEQDDEMETSDVKDSDQDEDDKEDEDSDNKKSKSTPKNKEKKNKVAAKEKPKKEKVKATKRKQASSDNEEPPAKKRKLPTDNQLTKLIEGILKNADLQEVTMKNVIQQVFDNYPGCDLSHKKSFIKETIKSVISA